MNRLPYFPVFQIRRRLHLTAGLCLKSKRPVAPWVNEGWWFEDHKPMKTPVTAEQRKASAAKYGLREQDYKPLDPEIGKGEYPDLGNINYDVKDPYENWSNPRHRRNFGEPVHYLFHLRTAEKFVTTDVQEMSPAKAWYTWIKMFLTAVLLFYLISVGGWGGPVITKPAKPKQYPYDFERAWPLTDPRNYPIENYTFEPAE